VKPFDYSPFGEAAAPLKENIARLRAALARGYRPPPRMSVAEWAARYRRFPEESPFPGPWRHSTAPYLQEIMEKLSPHDPCEEVVIMKNGQSGGSASAENWVGAISDISPGPAMYVQATILAAIDWAAEKLWPMIESTPRLNPARNGTIRAQSSRDGDGSTKRRIRFRRGGYLLLAGANSAATLRQHTIRFVIEDDLDQFPDDLDKQGSPEVMIDNRLKVYRRQGLSKRLKISTPTIKGASKIGAAYERSDKRRYYLKCPSCGARFDMAWSNLVWPEGKPEEDYLAAPCCGTVVEHWQKGNMSLPDGWISTQEVAGRRPTQVLSEEDFQFFRVNDPRSKIVGYHITGLISAFQTWGDLAKSFIAAQGDQNKLKTWTNLDLGDLFELKGATPDYDKLKELKEQDWGRQQMPLGPVATTIGADVQGDGIYYEKVGWGPNAESWSLDQGFIPGATDVKGEGAWKDFDAICRRPVMFPGGKSYPVDQVCVDAGYHTEAAEAFCKAHPNRLAVFGRDGWTRPILGRGENLRYETQGKRAGQASKKMLDKAFLVGTYGAKLAIYGYFRSTIAAAKEELTTGIATHIRGRCHFNRDAPDDWFEQVTSEAITVKVVNGYPKRTWEPLPGRQNHYLDCRVYNFAAAEKQKLETLTDAEWETLRAERCAAKDERQGDLLADPFKLQNLPAPAAPQGEKWVDAREDYL
jgi:phage terminase large subunit GpA-like protein